MRWFGSIKPIKKGGLANQEKSVCSRKRKVLGNAIFLFLISSRGLFTSNPKILNQDLLDLRVNLTGIIMRSFAGGEGGGGSVPE